jgi:hypothetical protein
MQVSTQELEYGDAISVDGVIMKLEKKSGQRARFSIDAGGEKKIEFRRAPRNPQHSLAPVLANNMPVSEAELRARLDALIKQMPLRSEQERGEHRSICRALDRLQRERAA